MNIQQDPENFASKANLDNALKLRNIWQDSLKTENAHIKAILQHEFFPYFLSITKTIGNTKKGYELESSIFISDKPILVPPSQMATTRPTKTIVQISFYYVPEINEEEDLENEDNEFDIIPAIFTSKEGTYINQILHKFSIKIGLPVTIIYE